MQTSGASEQPQLPLPPTMDDFGPFPPVEGVDSPLDTIPSDHSWNDFSWDNCRFPDISQLYQDVPIDLGTSSLALDMQQQPIPGVYPGWVPEDGHSKPPASTEGEFARNPDLSFTRRVMSWHDAFKRSPWSWTAAHHDNAATEEPPQLAECEEHFMDSSVVAEKLQLLSQPVSRFCESAARDALLALVLRHSSSTTPIRSFPSVSMLNILLQTFFATESVRINPFIHMASFNPDRCMSELLAAVAAAGATAITIPAVWNMGLALQERVRMAATAALYCDSRLARKSEMLQILILWIEVGLWSGSGRKMEVAEAAATKVPTVGLLAMSKLIHTALHL